MKVVPSTYHTVEERSSVFYVESEEYPRIRIFVLELFCVYSYGDAATVCAWGYPAIYFNASNSRMLIDAAALSVDEMMSGGVLRWMPYASQIKLFNAMRKKDSGERPSDVCPVRRENTWGNSTTAEIPLLMSAM